MTGKDDLTTLITNYLATLPGDYTARWKEMERLAGLAEGGAFAAPATHAATHLSGGSDPITGGALGPITSLSVNGAVTANYFYAATSTYYLGENIALRSNGAGVLKISNNVETDFSLLQFGGTTAAFPALKRSGVALEARLADDSAQTQIIAGDYRMSAAGSLGWVTRGYIAMPSSGVMTLLNAAVNDFSLLQFGGTTAAFPALKRSGGALQVRTADDSGWADVYAQSLILNYATGATIYLTSSLSHVIKLGTGTPEGVVAAGVGSIYLRTDGGAGTSFYVKQTGGGANTGWVAK